jgi:hypothetical protein
MGKQSLSSLIQTLRQWWKRNPDKGDPYARVRVPVRKGPGRGSAAIALKEPGE